MESKKEVKRRGTNPNNNRNTIARSNKRNELLTKDFYDIANIALKQEGKDKEAYDTQSILEVIKAKNIVNIIDNSATLQDYADMYKLFTPAVLERATRNAMRGNHKDIEVFLKVLWAWAPPRDDELKNKFMGIIRKISNVIEKHVPAAAKTIKFKNEMEAIYQEIENE